MPSLSPGEASPSSFTRVLPGAPSESLQSLTTYTFRWKRYIVYISGQQANILRSPTELVQAVTFDETLVAVKAEEGESGKIAVGSAGHAWILEPRTDTWNRVTWRKALELKREDAGDETRSICWGSEGEVLVGGSKQLSLFSTLPSSRNGTPASSPVDRSLVEERHALWSKKVSSPLKHAVFCPSASLLVTCGQWDRLVKIWRRLSFEDGLFDHAYLPHPGLVTHVEWRVPDPPQVAEDDTDGQSTKSYGTRFEEEPEILYTFCVDGIFRIWKTAGHHDLEMLTLHSTIDLVMAIPQSPSLTVNGAGHQHKPSRYAFLLSSGGVCAATSAAIAKRELGTVSHSIEHLKEISSRHPDIVVTLDGHGRMSAWGLQSIGHKRRPSTPSESSKQAYHIAHAEDMSIKFPQGCNGRFVTWFEGDALHVLSHSFDGRLSWWRGSVEQFFSPSAVGTDRLQQVANWTGNSGAIEGVIQVPDAANKVLAWSSNGFFSFLGTSTDQASEDEVRPTRVQVESTRLLDALPLGCGSSIVCATDTRLSLWSESGELVAEALYSLPSRQDLRIIALPTASSSQSGKSCFLVVAGAQFTRFTLTLGQDTSRVELRCCQTGALSVLDDANQALTLVNMHATQHPRKQGWLRLVGLSSNGAVARRDVQIEGLEDPHANTEPSLRFPSAATSPRLFEATSDLVAITNTASSELMILDLKEGYLEHREPLAEDVQSLRFSPVAEASARNMLAVVHYEAVDILAQGQYKPWESRENGIWQHVKRISIAGIELQITSVSWLGADKLAVAAGNGVFVTESVTKAWKSEQTAQTAADGGNERTARGRTHGHGQMSPLSVWHPYSLQQISWQGHFGAVIGIFEQLERKLRFFTEGDDLSPTLGYESASMMSELLLQQNTRLHEDTVNSLTDQLTDLQLPGITEPEQVHLKYVLDAVVFMQEHLQSLDANALRYLFSWKLQVLQRNSESTADPDKEKRVNGDHPDALTVPRMGWREIAFAYHSTAQQPLLDVLLNHHGTQIPWSTARSLGIPAWLRTIRAAHSEASDLASLEQIFESLAQTAYRAEYPPDPSRAALYFLALRKKPTLLALWRVAVGNREQRSTMNFLKRDFSTEENKTAARKNAYALMGKRRFEYAAAFFLLADDATSALRILAGQCEDLPLAVAVARVYCGDESPVFRRFMEERVLPDARQTGDRWSLSWASDVLGRKSEAAKALVVSVAELQDPAAEPMVRRWQHDDPLTLQLYTYLREVAEHAGRAKGKTNLAAEQHEYRAVLRASRILRRMGLWLLALELVTTWRFTSPPASEQVLEVEEVPDAYDEVTQEPASMLEAYDESKPKPSAEPPKSMLDDFDGPHKPAGAPNPMLDELDATTKSAAAPKSMLDNFASPSPQSAADTEESARKVKAAELLAKMQAKKEGTKKPGEGQQNGEKKKEPTQFKEPESSSILDSFGF